MEIGDVLLYFGAIFGGLGITFITYFILFKGIKGSAFMTTELKELMNANQMYIVLGSLIFWTIISQILITLKQNIFKVIIIVGTFALALAFAGNDLVNFIGVPIAAYNSYEIFTASGLSGDSVAGRCGPAIRPGR